MLQASLKDPFLEVIDKFLFVISTFFGVLLGIDIF